MTKRSLTKQERQGVINLGIFLIATILACMIILIFAQNLNVSLHQLQWKSANISHYRFHFARAGFWNSQNPFAIIEVRDNAIVSITLGDGSAITKGDRLYESFSDTTMDQLFSNLHNAQGADEVKIEYDSIYGFPSYVYVDPSKQTFDEEWGWKIWEFEVLP